MAFDISETMRCFTNEVTKDLLISIVNTGDTYSFATIQPGIKGGSSEALNYLSIDPILRAATCGWNPEGTVDLDQRKITTAAFQTQLELCAKDLECLWYSQILAPGAPMDLPTLMRDAITTELIQKVQAQIEHLLWMGNDGATTPDLIDGYVTILEEDTPVSIVALLPGTPALTLIDQVNAMLAAMPESIMTQTDLYLFMSFATYRSLMAEYRASGCACITAIGQEGANFQSYIPGTNVIAKAVLGLSGTTDMILTFGKNLVIGVDLLHEEEKFLFKYDEFEDIVKINLQFSLGAQIKYPGLVVVNF